MTGYNLSRAVADLLADNDLSPPSFTVNLYPEHWTLNQGSKFLYNNPVASLLDDIRAQRIPVDLLETFDSAGIPFYDGCMIVDLLDYRPLKHTEPILETPEKSRVVLQPNPESLWVDLCLLNEKVGGQWTDQEALEVEAQILIATAPPLCLDPDPHLSRIANNVHRVTALPAPLSLKRKAAALEEQEDETERARRMKILQFMNPRRSRAQIPSNRMVNIGKARDDVSEIKQQREARKLASQNAAQTMSGQQPMAPPSRPPSTINTGTIGPSLFTGLQPSSANQTPIKMPNGTLTLPLRAAPNSMSHATPPPPARSPFNPPSAATPAPAPVAAIAAMRTASTEATTRTASPVAVPPAAAVPSRPPSSQPINQQPHQLPQAQQYGQTAVAQSNQSFQPPIPSANFLRPPPIQRKPGDGAPTPAMSSQPLPPAQPDRPAMARTPTPATAGQLTPQQQQHLAQMTPQQQQQLAQMTPQQQQQLAQMRMQHVQAAQMHALRLQQAQAAGQATPKVPQGHSGSAQKQSPMTAQAQQAAAVAAANPAARASPLAATQSLASRSPMPMTAQQQMAQQQMAQQQMAWRHMQQQQQTLSAQAAQGGLQQQMHPQQHLQAQQHAAAAQAAQGKPAQAGMGQRGQVPHMMSQFQPMYNHMTQMGPNAGMNMQGARMPAGYWPMGRGAVINAQQQQQQQLAMQLLSQQPPGQAGLPQR